MLHFGVRPRGFAKGRVRTRRRCVEIEILRPSMEARPRCLCFDVEWEPLPRPRTAGQQIGEGLTRGTTAAEFADRSNRRARLDMAANRAQAAAQKALIQMSCAEPSPFPKSCYKILPCRDSTVVVQRFCNALRAAIRIIWFPLTSRKSLDFW